MTSPVSTAPGIWPDASDVLRDRPQYFRLLCLILALLALFGIIATPALRGATEMASQSVFAALVIAAAWVVSFHTRRPARLWLIAEGALFVLIANEVQNTRVVFAIMYLGLQYRAMFGSRGQATVTAVVYGVTLLLVHAIVAGGVGGIRPVVIAELTVGAFCGFIMHTLSDVLSRDAERQNVLLESEQRLRLVAENLREALVRTDLNDEITFANSRVRDVFGYEPAELIGKKARNFLLPEVATDSEDRLRQRLSGASEVYETVVVRKDGTRMHVEVSAGPYRETSGAITGAMAAISDISERKNLEERLRQGMRLESVGQLAGGVAHDFNNVLTAIKLNTEMLLTDLQPGDPARDSATEIARSAERGAMLTQQLLAFGRKQFLQPRRLRLGDIVAGALPTLRNVAGSRATLTFHDDTSADVVFADPMRIEHVLATLVRNASEAMPAGGPIAIDTRTIDVVDDQSLLTTSELPKGRFALLSVSDTGVGIAPDAMGRLFEPFFTTKPFGEGTGLGLASVYGIVRQSEGYVNVESTPGARTTFRIYLPIAIEPSSSDRVASEKAPA
jgi:PAS domain S-box-containing protein